MRLSVIIGLGASAVLGTAALLIAKVLVTPTAKPGPAPVAAVKTAPVVLAGSALAYGDKLEPGKLIVARYPENLVPPGAFSSISQITAGSGGPPVALAAIGPREPILPSKISGAGARKSVAIEIAPGMRAYAVRISDVAGVGGHILPGDRVDVMLTRQPGQSQPGAVVQETVSDVIVQDVRVLGINLNADPASTAAAAVADPRNATLEVSLADAQKLSIASGVGALSLALRRTGGTELAKAHPVLVRDLAPTASAPKAQPRFSPRQAAPDQGRSSVMIVQGDKTTSVSVPVEFLGGT